MRRRWRRNLPDTVSRLILTVSVLASLSALRCLHSRVLFVEQVLANCDPVPKCGPLLFSIRHAELEAMRSIVSQSHIYIF